MIVFLVYIPRFQFFFLILRFFFHILLFFIHFLSHFVYYFSLHFSPISSSFHFSPISSFLPFTPFCSPFSVVLSLLPSAVCMYLHFPCILFSFPLYFPSPSSERGLWPCFPYAPFRYLFRVCLSFLPSCLCLFLIFPFSVFLSVLSLVSGHVCFSSIFSCLSGLHIRFLSIPLYYPSSIFPLLSSLFSPAVYMSVFPQFQGRCAPLLSPRSSVMGT